VPPGSDVVGPGFLFPSNLQVNVEGGPVAANAALVVAKADGTNRVHYDVDAKSRSEVVMVSEAPLQNP